MRSSFKSQLTHEDIQKIIRNCFGCGAVEARELSDGWANTAYAVTRDDGETVILKVAPAQSMRVMRCEQNMMKTEVSVLKLLAKLNALPIPAVNGHDDSCSLIASEYFIMQRIQGEPYSKIKADLTQQEQEAVEHEIGVCNRIINECRGPGFGYYAQEERLSASWADAFYRMFSDVLADGRDAGVELPRPYGEIEQIAKSSLDVLQEVQTPSLIHWDLWNGNVFVQDGRISGIIDFERALWADPLMEHYFSHFEQSAAFEKGCGMSVQTPSQRERRALYDLYLDLVLWIECAYRQYEDDNHRKWAYENLEAGLQKFQTGRPGR